MSITSLWIRVAVVFVIVTLIEPNFAFAPQKLPQRPTTQNDILDDSLSLHSKMAESNEDCTSVKELDEKQLDFTVQYLNEHHGSILLEFVETFSDLGRIQIQKNAYTSGSYEIQQANLTHINTQEMELEVAVRKRKKESIEHVKIDLDAEAIKTSRSNPHAKIPPIPRDDEKFDNNLYPIDNMVRRLIRLCWIVQKPQTTGLLIQMAIQLGGSGVGKLKENLYLNQVPHNRYVREYFYDMASKAVMKACILCSNHQLSNRMKIVSMFPEMNPTMDSYRIGSLLELVRTIATDLVVEANLRVRVCVQQSMGTGIFVGVPKQLGGVAKLLQMMDWQSEEGESCEGMVGKYINFGGVGREHVVNEGDVDEDGNELHQDDVFIIIAPQSMVGTDTSIHGPLSEMVEAAGDRPVILLNPDLTDKMSSGGQQSFRGRQQRIDFADSFQTIYHFSNLYFSGTSYFPILGALTKLSPTEPWVAYQRRDYANDAGEVYVPIVASEGKPSGEDIMACMDR